MAESCTLFCKIGLNDFEAFKAVLARLQPTEILLLDDSPWPVLKCVMASGAVTFTRLVFVEQADPFTKSRWTTIVKVQSVAAANPEGAKTVEEHVRAVEAIVGIVAEPSFDDIANLPETIGLLAIEHDALIFNGIEFMDCFGTAILRV